MKFGRSRIPLIPAAVVFDLGFINSEIRPTGEDGYAAADNADMDFEVGNVGAGTGATVAKLKEPPPQLKAVSGQPQCGSHQITGPMK